MSLIERTRKNNLTNQTILFIMIHSMLLMDERERME
jgi:hypothetical protein